MREGIWEEHFHAEKAWGYYSNQDGRQDSFDLCQECYEKMLESFKINLH
jgi:ribosomal-protein-alanine N-acetyltransferase